MAESHKHNGELKEVRRRREILYDLHKLEKQAKLIFVVRIQDSSEILGRDKVQWSS